MFGVFPLQPAYGRDYTSLAALKADWDANKDFLMNNGRYCSKRDFPTGTVTFRYGKLRKQAQIQQ